MSQERRTCYYLSLGSNLGERALHLNRAVFLLAERDLSIRRRSSLYETEPLDMTDQPYFLNAVLKVNSVFSPSVLLGVIHEIEHRMGRTQTRDKGPRVIDIDILFAGDLVLRTEKLNLPHPRLHVRNFVLYPLLEIAPDFVHPVFKKTIRRICREGGGEGEVRRLEASPGWPSREEMPMTEA